MYLLSRMSGSLPTPSLSMFPFPSLPAPPPSQHHHHSQHPPHLSKSQLISQCRQSARLQIQKLPLQAQVQLGPPLPTVEKKKCQIKTKLQLKSNSRLWSGQPPPYHPAPRRNPHQHQQRKPRASPHARPNPHKRQETFKLQIQAAQCPKPKRRPLTNGRTTEYSK